MRGLSTSRRDTRKVVTLGTARRHHIIRPDRLSVRLLRSSCALFLAPGPHRPVGSVGLFWSSHAFDFFRSRLRLPLHNPCAALLQHIDQAIQKQPEIDWLCAGSTPCLAPDFWAKLGHELGHCSVVPGPAVDVPPTPRCIISSTFPGRGTLLPFDAFGVSLRPGSSPLCCAGATSPWEHSAGHAWIAVSACRHLQANSPWIRPQRSRSTSWWSLLGTARALVRAWRHRVEATLRCSHRCQPGAGGCPLPRIKRCSRLPSLRLPLMHRRVLIIKATW